MRAIESGDDQIVAAILSGPAMLSGLSPIEVDGFRTVWQRKKFPNELARLAQLEKAAGAAIVAEAKKFREATAAAIAQASGAH
jgi:hypothetical protein